MKNIKFYLSGIKNRLTVFVKGYTYASLLLLLVVSLIVTSCTKIIDLKLGNVSGLLVIEGNLTNVARHAIH